MVNNAMEHLCMHLHINILLCHECHSSKSFIIFLNKDCLSNDSLNKGPLISFCGVFGILFNLTDFLPEICFTGVRERFSMADMLEWLFFSLQN